MPVADLVLAELPAEQDVLAFALGEEVDESLADVLDDPAELLDSLDAASDAGGLALDRLVRFRELGGLKAPAVPGDLLQVAAEGRLSLLEDRAVDDHPLRKHSHRREQRVRFVLREVPPLLHRVTVLRIGAVRRSNIAVAAAFAVAALLVLTGCGQRSEPTGSKVDLYPVTVHQPAGPPIVLTHKPASVAALTPQAATLLSSLLGQTVEPARSPGKAELVVITPESLVKRTPHVYVAPDESISDVEEALTQLGLLLDRPIRGRQLVADIESKRKSVRARLRGVKPATVFVDNGFFTTVSTNSLLGDMIKEAGGKNIAGAAPQPGPFPVDKLRKLNPDYYLATSDSGTKLADLRRDPRTRQLNAVRRNGHFAILGEKVLQPGGEVGTELLAIAKYLHPDAFR